MLALLVGSVAWVYGFSSAGHAHIAIAGALVFVFGYVVVLTAEFLLLTVLRRGDPTPKATLGQLARAWWSEVVIAPRVFCWRQPFRSGAVADWLPEAPFQATPCSRGVVLVHGFACNRAFWNPWMTMLRKRAVPYVAVNLEPPFASIDDYATGIDAAVRKVKEATGTAPIIVAHSMGGLAVRSWLSRCQSDQLPARVMTIGTPHQGTWLARFGWATNSAQMRVDSEWQRSLRRSEAPGVHARFVCFYSNCDNMVLPPSHATLASAVNRHVPGCAHVDLAFHPDVIAEAVNFTRTVQVD